MTVSHEQIPRALAAAHQNLAAALAEGIRQFKAHLQYSNSGDVLRAIEAFVEALSQITGAREELQRRATLVERHLCSESAYTTARRLSLQSYLGQPHKPTASKLALDRLRESDNTPLFLVHVSEIRREIETVLDGGILNLKDASRQAYRSWRSLCRHVQRECADLEVDGCWYLINIYQAGEDDSTDRANVVKEFIQSEMGGAVLESIGAAADSLVDWASTRAICRDDMNSIEPSPAARNDGDLTSRELALPVTQGGAEGSSQSASQIAVNGAETPFVATTHSTGTESAFLSAATPPVCSVAHSPDFRSVRWFGKEFTFTATQAACVVVLWENWQQRTPVIGEVTILEAAGSSCDRLRDVFNKGKHPAWGELVIPAGKGAFQLAPRKES